MFYNIDFECVVKCYFGLIIGLIFVVLVVVVVFFWWVIFDFQEEGDIMQMELFVVVIFGVIDFEMILFVINMFVDFVIDLFVLVQ